MKCSGWHRTMVVRSITCTKFGMENSCCKFSNVCWELYIWHIPLFVHWIDNLEQHDKPCEERHQYRDSHVKDKTVSPTVLSLTWESPYLGKMVFILRRGAVVSSRHDVMPTIYVVTTDWPTAWIRNDVPPNADIPVTCHEYLRPRAHKQLILQCP